MAERRREDVTLGDIATRLEHKFPVFSRRWRSRKGSNPPSIVSESQQDALPSRTASSRSSSVSITTRRGLDANFDYNLSSSPTRSSFFCADDDDGESVHQFFIDIDKANTITEEVEERTATTPLLPPLLMDMNTDPMALQSPLQSPSVAEPNDTVSGCITPIDLATSPFPSNSPPLSTKHSFSSCHASSRPGHVSGIDTLSMFIADPNDEWANKLGHANFTIQPEPYVPNYFDLEACRQLRTEWDTARCNYTKHLVRMGEHYGVTSKTYQLTQEKWQATDEMWRQNNELTIAKTMQNCADAFATLKHTKLADASEAHVMTKIPTLNDPRSVGKFPQLGDEDIVGPMVQAAAPVQIVPSRKSKLLRLFSTKFSTRARKA